MPSKFTGRTERKRRACFLEVRSNLRSCWSHCTTPRFITETFITEELDDPDGVFGGSQDDFRLFDHQEEFFCRNALKRLGAYDEDNDDDVYLLATAEDGNAIAQLEIADMCSPSHSASTHFPSHHVAHCRAVTARGAWYPKLFVGTRLPAHKNIITHPAFLTVRSMECRRLWVSVGLTWDGTTAQLNWCGWAILAMPMKFTGCTWCRKVSEY